MAIMTKNPVLEEYQAALRAYDKEPSDHNKERLDQAKKARESLSESLRIGQKSHENSQEQGKGQPTTEKPSRTPRIEPESKLEEVKNTIKQAYQTLRGLREENKELHRQLKENVIAKRKLNEKVLPELRKQKKTLQSSQKR